MHTVLLLKLVPIPNAYGVIIFKRKKIHFIHQWFGLFTNCLPLVSKLTLYPLEVLFVNSCYKNLTPLTLNTKQNKNIR